jgi:hypothetical protein
MRVTIEHLDETSLFKKFKVLKCKIEFTETEKAVIKRAGLDDYVFFEAEQPSFSEGANRFFVKSLVQQGGLKLYYSDEASRLRHDARLREALTTLKSAIEANSGPAKTKDTFEL